MPETASKYIAQNLIRVHGLRARAVVGERIAEARVAGDTSGLELWQNVDAAIGDLRRTAACRTTREVSANSQSKSRMTGSRPFMTQQD